MLLNSAAKTCTYSPLLSTCATVEVAHWFRVWGSRCLYVTRQLLVVVDEYGAHACISSVEIQRPAQPRQPHLHPDITLLPPQQLWHISQHPPPTIDVRNTRNEVTSKSQLDIPCRVHCSPPLAHGQAAWFNLNIIVSHLELHASPFIVCTQLKYQSLTGLVGFHIQSGPPRNPATTSYNMGYTEEELQNEIICHRRFVDKFRFNNLTFRVRTNIIEGRNHSPNSES